MGQSVTHDECQAAVFHYVGPGIYSRVNLAIGIRRSQYADSIVIFEILLQIHISLLNVCKTTSIYAIDIALIAT
jgi:hypothetical protein